jgi:kinesin family member 13
MLEIYNEKV